MRTIRCIRCSDASASAAPSASAASGNRSVSMRRKLRRYSSIVKTASVQTTDSAQRNIAAHFRTQSRTLPPPKVQNQNIFAPDNCARATRAKTKNIIP